MRREYWERFPRHRLQRKPLVSDHDIHQGTCVTHVPWCMLGSLTRGGGENVPGIPSECTTRNLTYLARGPLHDVSYLQRTLIPFHRYLRWFSKFYSTSYLLSCGFLWSRWRGNRSRNSRRMCNPQFTYYVDLHIKLQWVQWNLMSPELRITKSHGIPWYLVTFGLSTQELHGIFNGSPRKSDVNWSDNIKVTWNSMELYDNWFGDGGGVPWNSMEYFMEFHGTLVSFEMAPS